MNQFKYRGLEKLMNEPTPVFSDRKRSAYDQRYAYFRYCIRVALYGPNPATWPRHVHMPAA